MVDNARTLARAIEQRGVGIVGGGTDTHMVLVDLSSLLLLGSEAEAALARAGITSNKNPVPFDEPNPAKWSGLRLGVSAVTSRGFGTAEMGALGDCIAGLIHATGTERVDQVVANASARVNQIAARGAGG